MGTFKGIGSGQRSEEAAAAWDLALHQASGRGRAPSGKSAGATAKQPLFRGIGQGIQRSQAEIRRSWDVARARAMGVDAAQPSTRTNMDAKRRAAIGQAESAAPTPNGRRPGRSS